MGLFCLQVWICEMCKKVEMLGVETSVYTDEMMEYPLGWNEVEHKKEVWRSMVLCPKCYENPPEEFRKYDN